MLPHSYTVDSLSQSQDIASAILAASTPPKISAACAYIESFLHSHTPDQSRHFYSIAFPTLICKLFGFDDAAASTAGPPSQSLSGWIDAILAANDLDLAARVFSLLSQNGTLMSSISAVDSLSLVKYVFPIERLPEWARFMLSNEKDSAILSDLCPLFKGKVQKDSIKSSSFQVHLNVFEYYMFWFAYYPICKGNNENVARVAMKRSKKFRLENWTPSIRGFSGSAKRDSEHKLECNLYIRLLYAYLRAFVPVFDLNAHQPYRSSLLHYGSGHDGSVMMRAEFLVNAFMHYWLVDNDFSPFPLKVAKLFGVVFPFRTILLETPPTGGLGEVVKLFVKYLNLSWGANGDGYKNHAEYIGSPRWKTMDSGSFDVARSKGAVMVSSLVRPFGSWNTYIQRPLYRFILRTFLFCPMTSPIKNASQVFSVWVSYMEPWNISLDDFLELDVLVNGSSKDLKKEESESRASGYTSSWQGYVLSNYLYYSSMVIHFIGFAHKFLHTDPEIVVQMVLKVMSILTLSKELMDLIKSVDTVFHSKQDGPGKSLLSSLSGFVPSILEQLQDWEDGLCESDADGSFLHENWNKDLRLFSDGEDGGRQLLQLFILRAEAELQAISENNLSQNLECIDSLKSKATQLFSGHTIKPISFCLEAEQPQQTRDELFKPRRVGSQAIANVKYRGDWMNRPISEDEIAWLAKLLVHLSCWINERLGLNQPENKDANPELSYVDVSSDMGNVTGPTEAIKVIMCAVGSWLMMFGGLVLGLMRRHGLRVNLRVMASKKFLMLLVIMYGVFWMMKKALGSVFM